MRNRKKTIEELLTKFPQGFSVAPGGEINRTLMASSHFANIARQYPVVPSHGGYLVVEMTDEGLEGEGEDFTE